MTTQANNVAIESSQINSSGVLQPAGGGTGVTTSTGSGNNVLSTSPTLVTPALGTPSALVLTNATGLPSSALPTGSVLQVINSIYTTQTTTSSTSFIASGLTATITPKFSTSKILVLCNPSMYYTSAGTYAISKGALYKNGSSLVVSTNCMQGDSAYYGPQVRNAFEYYDSPATTSSTTYAFYMAVVSGNTVAINYTTPDWSSITLMEIAG